MTRYPSVDVHFTLKGGASDDLEDHNNQDIFLCETKDFFNSYGPCTDVTREDVEISLEKMISEGLVLATDCEAGGKKYCWSGSSPTTDPVPLKTIVNYVFNTVEKKNDMEFIFMANKQMTSKIAQRRPSDADSIVNQPSIFFLCHI